jgi:hypothetical protein
VLQGDGPVVVAAGDDGGGGLAEGDLAGEVGPGQHRDVIRRHLRDLGDDLAHPFQRAQLDALGEADQRPSRRKQRPPRAEVVPERLRREREHDGVGALQSDRRDGRRLQRRQLDIRQVFGIAPALGDRCSDLRATRPQHDVTAGVGENLREGRPPRPGTEDGDPLDLGRHAVSRR